MLKVCFISARTPRVHWKVQYGPSLSCSCYRSETARVNRKSYSWRYHLRELTSSFGRIYSEVAPCQQLRVEFAYITTDSLACMHDKCDRVRQRLHICLVAGRLWNFHFHMSGL